MQQGSTMPSPLVIRPATSPTGTRRGRSPGPSRRVPSPLRHAEFRPLALEYAEETEKSQSPTACKYFPEPLEEVNPEEMNPSGFCSAVRTVGYSTVGGKTFMSGKCPHCFRMVKSDTQVCTPGVTPPTSPLMAALKSPLRWRSQSPKARADDSRSPSRTPSRQRSRSPLRSLKGSIFGDGSKDTDDTAAEVAPKTAPGASSTTAHGRSLSPTRRGRGLPPWEVAGTAAPVSTVTATHERAKSLADLDPARSRSPARSLSGDAPVPAAADAHEHANSLEDVDPPRSRSPRRSPAKGSPANTRVSPPPAAVAPSKNKTKASLYVDVDMANDDASECSTFSPRYAGDNEDDGRSLSPTRSPSAIASYTSPAQSPTRSISKSPSTRASRNRFRASGTDSTRAAQDSPQPTGSGYTVPPGGVGVAVGVGNSPKNARSVSPKNGRSVSPARGKSVRGTSSPGPATSTTASQAPQMRGPHSPMHSPYKGSFFDNTPLDCEGEFGEAEGKSPKARESATSPRSRSRSPLRSPIQNPFGGNGGLRSPLRSPFSSTFFEEGQESSSSSQLREGGGERAPMGTE